MQHIVRRPKHFYSLHRGIPPPLNQPENWFRFTDKDSAGCITTHQVLFSLKASLRPHTWFEDRTIRKKLEESSWPFLDNNVSYNQFMSNDMNKVLMKLESDYKALFNRRSGYGRDPYKNERAAFEGLNPGDPIIEEYLVPENTISTVASATERNRNANDRINVSVIPSITENPKKWFDYFDYEHIGILCKDDLMHGLITSTSLFTPSTFGDEEEERQSRMYETIINIWDIYDPNGNGIITKDDFLVNGGLADTLSSFVSEQERNNGAPSVYGSESSTVVATDITSIKRSMRSSSTIAEIPTKGTIANISEDPKNPPLLTKSNAEQWFNYLDTSHKRYLTKQQIINAVQLSLINSSSSPFDEEIKNQIQQSIETIWCIFIPDDAEQVVTKTDFLCVDDHLCDNLIQFIQDWNRCDH